MYIIPGVLVVSESPLVSENEWLFVAIVALVMAARYLSTHGRAVIGYIPIVQHCMMSFER